MSTRNASRWIKLAVLLLSAITVLALMVSGALADPRCKKVNGKFTLQAVAGPTCLSPVGICATGVYQGSLKGHNEFTGTSVVTTADTPATAVILLTGDNVIHTGHGDLITKDAIVLNTTGAGEFGEVDTIVSGTGDWVGAIGRLTATGTFAGGVGAGDFQGEVCTP